jgi:hypothetical protein
VPAASAACSVEGVRPHPVSESAPMLMAMAMFFLSKRPLRAYGRRAEGSHSLGGEEKHEAILGPGRRGRSGGVAALRIRSPAPASGAPTGPSLVEQASTLLDRYQRPQNAGKSADGPWSHFPELTCGNTFMTRAGNKGPVRRQRPSICLQPRELDCPVPVRTEWAGECCRRIRG